MSREYPCIYFEKDGKCRKFSDDTAISYCVMGPCPEQTLSNADQIRAMSDEELTSEMSQRSISTVCDADLARVTAERDAAIEDLEEIMFKGGHNIDTCHFCTNGQCYGRGGTQACEPKWRGQKEG